MFCAFPPLPTTHRLAFRSFPLTNTATFHSLSLSTPVGRFDGPISSSTHSFFPSSTFAPNHECFSRNRFVSVHPYYLLCCLLSSPSFYTPQHQRYIRTTSSLNINEFWPAADCNILHRRVEWYVFPAALTVWVNCNHLTVCLLPSRRLLFGKKKQSLHQK
jgi:hypothetical protein